MHFQKLPEHVKKAIEKLPKDQEFQQRFGTDSVLDELDAELFNPAESLKDLLTTLNFKYELNGRQYNNITPVVWSYLWCIESPFVKESPKPPTQADVDLFFYVLENGVEDSNVIKNTTNAIGWCERHKLNVNEAVEIIRHLIKNAFSPLKMFPSTKNVVGKQMALFDADWITSLCARVHAVTGYAPDYVMNNMSITAACYYYIQYSRMQGVEHIERRPDEEILRLQDERACTLVIDRLIELNVVTEADRAELFKLMTATPEK